MKGNDIRKDIQEALANENLRGALGRFGDAYVGSREAAYQGKDFQVIREEIKCIKRYAADNMEELARRFVEKASERGAVVYRAETAGEAREYILNLARDRGVKTVVKSKSMASEEIHLNSHLAGAGLDVVETDLGEWIIQLSGQRPSHMVMPAIHMTRGEVAGVFSRETGEDVPADIPRMVKLARERLRRKFLTAEMGISGANIAVAETGTVVMVTNEGNGRLTTTLPPLHVVLVGMEKLVAGFSDTAPILEALPRSATAQRITSYVTMLTGPAQAVDSEGNLVEKEMHIVLLNNGRTAMQRDPVFKEALQCIRCASCLNVCPVFQLVGGHVFGHVYTGGIGTILTAFFDGMQSAEDIQSLCVGCERCKDFCPGKIDIPRLISELRNRQAGEGGLSVSQRILLKTVLPNRKIFHGLLRAAAVAQKPLLSGEGTIRHLPLIMSGQGGNLKLPAIAKKPLRDILKEDGPKAEIGSRPVVGLFAGCLVDFVYPGIGNSAVKVLEKMGFKVVFPQGQTCCGYPARQMGAPEVMEWVARQNLEAFGSARVDYIITPCPTCTHSLKNLYPEILEHDGKFGPKALEMSGKVYDFAEFACRQAGEAMIKLKPLGKMVTYHDSCHLKRNLGVSREPRDLIKMAGAEFVEMEGADLCCGFGGSYSLKYPDLSEQILGRKLKSIYAAGAPMVAVECPGCLLQIRRGLDGSPTQVKHLAEILSEQL
ncbi:MAG: L-lactate dehydrogenase (quinone) large subunit LdhH [Bacillota bacterium]